MTTAVTIFDERDLTALLRFPVISWSSFNAFTSYDQDKWYKQYVLGEKAPMNALMQGGVEVGRRIIEDPSFLPSIPRPEIFEQELRGKLGKINLMGHIDGWSPSSKELWEYKTSINPNRWTQDAVDKWGQLDFYALLIWLNYKVKPDDLTIRLVYIPMQEMGNFEVKQFGEPKVFVTKRTMKDVLLFGAKLQVVHRQMSEFVAAQQDMRYNELVII